MHCHSSTVNHSIAFVLNATIIVVVVLSSLTTLTSAMQLKLRPRQGEVAAIPPDSAATLRKLQAMFRDSGSFGDALGRFADQTSGGGDFCRIEGFFCNEKSQLEKIVLTDLSGVVDFSAAPRTLHELVFHGGRITGMCDLSHTPISLKRVSFFMTHFSQPSLTFHRKQSGLQYFRCVNCGLETVLWNTVPALLHLDLSLNRNIRKISAPLPGTLQYLNISGCGLRQSLDSLGALPPSLLTFDASINELTGAIGTINLPPYLEYLNISHNLIDGAVDGEDLPIQLTVADLGHNSLSGVVTKMKQLVSITHLYLAHNKIEGIDWTLLPEQLLLLDVSFNALSGSLPFSAMQPGLQTLRLQYNQLEGELDFSLVPRSIEELNVAGNKLSGKVDFTKIQDTMRFVFVNDNQFTGRPDLTKLPVDLRRIIIKGNPWDKDLPVEMMP